MVHGLAAQSGGAFRLESELGKGTTATLWVPVSIDAVERAAPEVLSDPPPSSHRQTILLVDDEPLVREGTAAMLRDAGYDVIEAKSGDEALQIARAGGEFDALVTDFAMPRMTGVEVAQAIRSMRPGTPVMLITGFASLADTAVAGIPRLAKPFRQAEINAAVANLLDQSAKSSDGRRGTRIL
jgi:CheY-like chemotaxis protein